MKRYIDTSVLVSFVVNEVHTARVRQQMPGDRVGNLISDWTLTEFYAALSFKVRMGQISTNVKEEAEIFFEDARSSLLRVIPVQRTHFSRAAELGGRSDLWLRAGDALHLAIAELTGAALWTLDKRLNRAAIEIGLVTE